MKEPVAIVGIGCRFPGGIDSPQTFWQALCEGRDAISEVPEDRWDLRFLHHPNRDKADAVYTRMGGFLNDIEKFDPQFFGISPREAPFIDPQQRLLMEVAWEAMEDGGCAPESLAGSSVGVFVGLFMHDYENIHSGASERKLFGPHSATGMSTTIAANRLSYFFDFKGPSMVVDTACSSSLVAVHLACRSIWENESEMALAGGVNALLRPEMTMALCRASFLSEEGHCKSFDAAADGYTRSEGAGMVLLKPLSRAVADGDPVVAVIRGSAVNQDGRSEGLTVPDARSQVAVISRALENAGVSPEKIRYVEAHGTGTPVGDPIEARAIGKVLSGNRPADAACIMGSVKSNIGHTESAAGIASLIKTALILSHGRIPPNLHFNHPNPQIPFDELKLRVPVAPEPWPENSGPRFAGVNAFGFGGTNAHVVMESFPPHGKPAAEKAASGLKSESEPAAIAVAVAVPLSARSPKALEDMADALIRYLPEASQKQGFDISDLGYTTALRRGHHPHRLTVAAADLETFTRHLSAWRNGENRPGMAIGHTTPGRPVRLCFVFSGMGPQWWDMGRELYEKQAVFREALLACDRLFGTYTKDWSITREIEADEAASRIHETRIAQPCIFSLQVALAALWRSWGVVPETVVGHSIGEIAAAHVSGSLSLEDAVRICFHRGRLLQNRDGLGSMLAVGMGEAEAVNLMADISGTVSVGAVNSPESVTLSGETAALEQIAQKMESLGVFARMLKVTVPYHSELLDPILAEFEASLSGIRPDAGQIPMVSTVNGSPVEGRNLDAAYWTRNLRQPVRFAAATETLVRSGMNTFVEIGPHPVLAPSMRECSARADHEAILLPSLRRGQPEDLTILGTLGALYAAGAAVSWNGLWPKARRLVKLPAYPWQKTRYWSESETSQRIRKGLQALGGAASMQAGNHPLLGGRLDTVHPTWQGEIDLERHAFLSDHRVDRSIVFPAAAYIELALAAARELHGASGSMLRDLVIDAPLLLRKDRETAIQLAVDSEDGFSIHGKSAAGDGPWDRHASGKLDTGRKPPAPRTMDVDSVRKRCGRETGPAACYGLFLTRDLDYGPDFQGIQCLWNNDGEAVAELQFSKSVSAELSQYHFHPVVLDNGFQVLAAISAQGAYLPVAVDRVCIHAKPEANCWCHARLTVREHAVIKGDIDWCDANGNLLAEVRGLTCRRMAASEETSGQSIAGHLYGYRWKRAALPGAGMNASASAGFPPSPAAIADALQPTAELLTAEYHRDTYYTRVVPKLDRLTALYISEAFEKMGWQGGIVSDDTAEKLGVIPEHRPLFECLAEILQNEKKGDDSVSANDFRAQTLSEYPAYLAELSLLHRCGSKLADVLTGREDPLSIIFSPGSTAAEQLYHSSPTCRIYNELLQEVVKKLLDRLPEGETLNILEIGAGTGALASHLLPLLDADRSTYRYTDISRAFLQPAEKKFSAFDFVTYRTLDIEKDPLKQGFSPNTFDVILASDVIHATSDIGDTLDNVKKLLASKGLFLLVELTCAPHWFHLVFGMLEGWWRFSDKALRPHLPLLKSGQWIQSLVQKGFDRPSILADRKNPADALHNIILARGPEIVSADDSRKTALAAAPKNLDEKTIPGSVILLSDRTGVADRLGDQLRENGIDSVLVTQGDGFEQRTGTRFIMDMKHPEEFEQVLDAAAPDTGSPPVVVCLWPLAENRDDLPSTEALLPSVSGPLRVFQALAKRSWNRPPVLWLVTNGAQQAGKTGGIHPDRSTVWGLGRVMVTEHPDLSTRMADLGPTPAPEEIDALCAEILRNDGEDEIALRGSRRYVHRLCRTTDYSGSRKMVLPFRVELAGRLGFDACRFRETRRTKPGAGKVEIEIRAAGVNFKDVAKISGILKKANPAAAVRSDRLGLECTGVISAVGLGVTGFQLGDAVMGLVLDCFAGYTITDPRALVKIPDGISPEAAATVPLAFLTAWYALNRLAGIKKDERVLIHTATGGVGLAAIQVARAAGAKILVTAGTPEKRNFLRSMGIGYVGDSRSTEFAEEIMAVTRGEGVDVVLNTLPVKSMEASLSVLKPMQGRFVEISNVYEKSLPLTSPKKGLSFFTFDLETMIGEHPALAGEMLSEIAEKLSDRTFTPLPYRVFPVSAVSEALRQLSRGIHTGKLVLNMTDPCLNPEPTAETISLNAEGSYLITGGLGGLGLAVARWLISCGAGHLVLAGRSGAATEEAKLTVEAMRESGAEVRIATVDVTNKEQVVDLLAQVKQTMPPLKGVLHAAMVLDDAPLLKTAPSGLMKVMAPKIDGARHLHEQTIDLDLDFFICFSSFAALVGNADQGGYAAANAFLDSLAAYRKAEGLPALAIGWGPIGEAGYVARNDDIRNHLKKQGITDISLKQVFRVICHGLAVNADHMGMIPADWRQMRKYSAAINRSPRFADLVRSRETDTESDRTDPASDVLSAPPEQRRQALEAMLTREVAGVLGLAPSDLAHDQPIEALGFDSLMAVELVVRIETITRLSIPKMMLLNKGLTVSSLADMLEEELPEIPSIPTAKSEPKAPIADPPGREPSPPPVEAKSEQQPSGMIDVDALSDEEVDAMLQSMLAEKEDRS